MKEVKIDKGSIGKITPVSLLDGVRTRKTNEKGEESLVSDKNSRPRVGERE